MINTNCRGTYSSFSNLFSFPPFKIIDKNVLPRIFTEEDIIKDLTRSRAKGILRDKSKAKDHKSSCKSAPQEGANSSGLWYSVLFLGKAGSRSRIIYRFHFWYQPQTIGRVSLHHYIDEDFWVLLKMKSMFLPQAQDRVWACKPRTGLSFPK